MAKNYKTFSYFESRPDIVKIFEDLEAFHDYCRFELRNFDPAELYRKDSKTWNAYMASKRPKKPYQGNKPWSPKPKFEKK